MLCPFCGGSHSNDPASGAIDAYLDCGLSRVETDEGAKDDVTLYHLCRAFGALLDAAEDAPTEA